MILFSIVQNEDKQSYCCIFYIANSDYHTIPSLRQVKSENIFVNIQLFQFFFYRYDPIHAQRSKNSVIEGDKQIKDVYPSKNRNANCEDNVY